MEQSNQYGSYLRARDSEEERLYFNQYIGECFVNILEVLSAKEEVATDFTFEVSRSDIVETGQVQFMVKATRKGVS